jgi:O-antigen/teichoic acid export membrane protein
MLLSIRGLSVLAKFLFTILFFKYSESVFGEYSLLSVTILLLVYVLGADFYSYANRELLNPGAHKQQIIFNQFLFYSVLYVILFPLVYWVYKYLGFSSQYFYLFYFVLITEHLGFEFYRLLFIFKKPLAANINLFLRNGLWVFAVVYLLFLKEDVNIPLILQYWLVGNLAGLFFSLLIVTKKRDKILRSAFVPDWKWIKKGIFISTPYILGTIAYKTIEFADRYMIDYFMDKKAVGVYSFFANMANVMNIVLFTLVVSVLYPYLVEGIMENNKQKTNEYFTRFKKEVINWSIGLLVVLSILLPILLIIINKTEYLSDFYVFLLLALSNFFLNLSFLYHYILYAHKKDWLIFKATLVGAIINILFNFILIPYLGIGGAAISTFFSFLVILFLKKYQSRILI